MLTDLGLDNDGPSLIERVLNDEPDGVHQTGWWTRFVAWPELYFDEGEGA